MTCNEQDLAIPCGERVLQQECQFAVPVRHVLPLGRPLCLRQGERDNKVPEGAENFFHRQGLSDALALRLGSADAFGTGEVKKRNLSRAQEGPGLADNN